MTIHRIYAENGDRAGFWVQHRDWANTCAQVQSVAGQEAGALRGSGLAAAAATSAAASSLSEAMSLPAPVLMHVFDVRSGRRLPDDAIAHDPDDRNYARIAEPYWHHEQCRPFIPARKGRADGRVRTRGGAP